MRLRRGTEYLDFDGEIGLSYQTSWNKSISSSRIISVQFEVTVTSHNLSILGLTDINQVNKPIYHQFTWTLETGSMDIVGSIRVESKDDFVIGCSFLSNGFDFLTLITGKLSDIIFQDYPFTGFDANEEGWVSPLVNNGNNTRLITNDFSNYGALNNLPCFYVKTIIKDLFNGLGIKLLGNLTKDWVYNHLAISNDSVRVEYNDAYIDRKTVYVGKTSSQAVAAPNTTVTFDEGGIYFDNPSLWDDASDEYISEFSQDLIAEINIVTDTSGNYGVAIVDSIGTIMVSFSILGQSSGYKKVAWDTTVAGERFHVLISKIGGGAFNILPGSSLKLYPFNRFAFRGVDIKTDPLAEYLPNFIMPSMTNKEFVSFVFGLFNPVISFNPSNKELTVNLFKNIKTNEVDWSDKLVSYRFDYTEFISDYGKRSEVVWDDPDDDFIDSYNERNINQFGGGAVNIDNDFIPEKEELLEIPFAPSMQELNDVANAYLPTFNFFNRSYSTSIITVTSVTNSLGNALFNTGNGSWQEGQYVELSTFTEPTYNGIGKIESVSGNNFTVEGVTFVSNDNGIATQINIQEQKQTPRLLLVLNTEVGNFSNLSAIDYGSTTKSTVPYAWVVKPTIGKPIDTVKNVLAFDQVNITGFDGLTLKDNYYREFSDMVNDPIKLIGQFNLSQKDFVNLDSSTAIRLKTKEFNCLFFLNKIPDFLSESTEVELLKLR